MITATKNGQTYDLLGDRIPKVSTLPTNPSTGTVVFYTVSGSLLVYYGTNLGWKPPWNQPWGLQASFHHRGVSYPPSTSGALADGLGMGDGEQYANIGTAHTPEPNLGGSHSQGVWLPAGRSIQVTVNISRVEGWPTTGYFSVYRGLGGSATPSDTRTGLMAASSGVVGMKHGLSMSFMDEVIPLGNVPGRYTYNLYANVVDAINADPYFILYPPANMSVVDLGPADGVLS